MQKKRLATNSILDKMHRGVVYTCMGVTLYCTFLLGMKVYQYYTVTKPERKKAELQLITEGSQDQAKELKF